MSKRDRRERKRLAGKGQQPERAEAAAAGEGLGKALASRLRGLAATRWFLPAALVVLTLAVWARSFAVPVLDWDDNVYLYQDSRVERLSAGNMWKMLTGGFFANYHPVTTLTYAFDRAIYGRREAGFHVTQLAFYVGGVVLLYYLFRAILGSRGAAFAGAALYATHAIHVEAVAWLAQRKDVVCLFFYSGAILAYVRYAREEERPWRRYAAALALAAAAMLSKGYAVVLPGAFVAYDLCFAGRFRWRQVIDKLPFVALAAAVTAYTIHVQGRAAALVKLDITAWQRFVALAKIFALYVARSLLPVHLSAKYIVGVAWLWWWVAVLGVAFGAGAVGGFVLLRRRLPAAAFGIALFVLPLATVMSTFWTLHIWMADRYLFFPTMGSSLTLAAAGLWLWRSGKTPAWARAFAIPSAAAVAVALYSVLTVLRIGVWTSPVALWSDTLRKHVGISGSGPFTERELYRVRRDRGKLARLDAQICSALASACRKAGDERLARALVLAAPRRAKGESGGELGLASQLIEGGAFDKAIETLRPVVEGGSWHAPYALVLTGRALRRKGQADAARRRLREALELYTGNDRLGTEAMNELGSLEFMEKRYEEAASWYRRAREAVPGDPYAVFFLGRSREEMGRPKEAYRLYEEALGIETASPTGSINLADTRKQMGVTARKLGRVGEAVAHFEEALRLAPDHPERKAIEDSIRLLRSMRPAPAPRAR